MSGRAGEQTRSEIGISCLGYSVKADIYDASKKEVVLILIGFTSQKAHYVEMANFIVEQTGKTVIALDYSGHGVSPFEIENITPAQNFLEVITTFDWIRQEYPDAKITVFGSSYGSFLATQLTKYREFEQLILRVPAIYRPSDFYTKWGETDTHQDEYRLNTPEFNSHPLFKRASNFKGKTLVITHEIDELCPPNSTMPFVRAFHADHWEEPGLSHGFNSANLSEEERLAYYKRITDWMKRVNND